MIRRAIRRMRARRHRDAWHGPWPEKAVTELHRLVDAGELPRQRQAP